MRMTVCFTIHNYNDAVINLDRAYNYFFLNEWRYDNIC